MKLLHVVQGYFPAIGGTEILVQRVSEEIVKQFQDQVSVFTTDCYNGEGFWKVNERRIIELEEVINGVYVRRFRVRSYLSALLRPIQRIWYRFEIPGHDWMRTFFGGPIICELTSAIQKYEADVVMASSFPLMHMHYALKGAKRSNKPIVLHGGLHPEDKWGYERDWIYTAIQDCDHYIANTEFEKQYLVNEKGVDLRKISVVGAGVDIQDFLNIETNEARIKLGLPLNVPIVGFIGQIGAHKGVDTLLKSMHLVWERIPEARLLIAGARTSFATVIDTFLSDPLTREKTTVLYNFDNEFKPYLFNALDVFIYPSGFESFGIAFLEAWSARKPVIGCNRGAVPYVVDAGNDGILVEYKNETDLASAILLLVENQDLALEMGINGHRKVMERYTWKEIAKRFREIYNQVLEKKKH
ncbi:glycosyltransferase family 4 protein [Bellilinea sp.]